MLSVAEASRSIAATGTIRRLWLRADASFLAPALMPSGQPGFAVPTGLLPPYFYNIMNWQEYITQDPAVLLGKPVIRGTRISVELLLELMEQGWTHGQIFESYPQLPQDVLPAVFAFLKDRMQHGAISESPARY